jgi:hypothetical protein
VEWITSLVPLSVKSLSQVKFPTTKGKERRKTNDHHDNQSEKGAEGKN